MNRPHRSSPAPRLAFPGALIHYNEPWMEFPLAAGTSRLQMLGHRIAPMKPTQAGLQK
jgi:hypothetical protein